MNPKLQIAKSFLQTLWVSRKTQTRTQFEKWQKKQLKNWLKSDLTRVDFYNQTGNKLSDLPIIDKQIVMSNFASFNKGNISTQEAWAAFQTTGRHNDINIGASTGTSGNRTLYAITDHERYRWLGVILAKAMPLFFLSRQKIAVILPQNSSLYDGANQTRFLSLRFFDLREGMENLLERLEVFLPDTIIAPPRVMRLLAERTEKIQPKNLFVGGETLDPIDKDIIEARFGVQLGQIYMASEGLFAVSCKHGRLHLAEDSTFFEFEPVGDGLVTPLVTSFRRRFQIMARYKMNDVLRLSNTPCPCKSPLRVVDEVIGRMDDVFSFSDKNNKQVLITPDIIRNAVLNASRKITDFRIQQKSANQVILVLKPEIEPACATAAKTALAKIFAVQKVMPEIQVKRDPLAFIAGQKLRRVECQVKQ